MTTFSSASSARNLFVESKARLSERIQVNVNTIGSVAKQIVKGSKAPETLMHTARNFALQEYAIENSEENLRKMDILVTHLHLQLDAIERSSHLMEDVRDQLNHLHC